MKPGVPLELDGHALPVELRERFARLIDAIYAIDPMRYSGAILQLAEIALRATCRLTPFGWVSVLRYTLDGGRGPSFRLR